MEVRRPSRVPFRELVISYYLVAQVINYSRVLLTRTLGVEAEEVVSLLSKMLGRRKVLRAGRIYHQFRQAIRAKMATKIGLQRDAPLIGHLTSWHVNNVNHVNNPTAGAN